MNSNMHSITLYFGMYNSSPYFLYANVLPQVRQTSLDRWIVIEGKREFKHYISLVLHQPLEKLEVFVDALVQEKSFSEACQLINVSPPKLTSKFKSIEQYIFDKKAYQYRDQVTYKQKPTYIFPEDKQSFYGQSENSVCYVSAYFHIIPQIYFDLQDDAKIACDYLEKETGIQFTQNSFSRLGNIEFCAFPATSTKSEEKVYLEWLDPRKEGQRVKVTLHDDFVGVFIINLRVENGHAIVLDEVQILDTKKLRYLYFNLSESVSSTTLKVWKKEGSWTFLIFEKTESYIREIHLSGMINSKRAIIKSHKTQTIKERSKGQSNTNAIENVEYLVQGIDSIVGREDQESWRLAINEMVDWKNQQRAFLSESNALFLDKGWKGSEKHHQWFKKLSGLPINKMIYIDPYADTEALRFFSRYERSGIVIRILNDLGISNQPEVNKTEMISLAESMSHKNIPHCFDLLTVREESLHDRYLLMLDDDRLIKGFHFSNSLQGANVRYPLLITEIQLDVAYQIKDWFEKLKSNANIESFFNSIDYSERKRERKRQYLLDQGVKKNIKIPEESYIQKNIVKRWMYLHALKYSSNQVGSVIENTLPNLLETDWDDLTFKMLRFCEDKVSQIFDYEKTLDMDESNIEELFRIVSRRYTYYQPEPIKQSSLSPKLLFGISSFIQASMRFSPAHFVRFIDEMTTKYSGSSLYFMILELVFNVLLMSRKIALSILQVKSNFIQSIIASCLFENLIKEKLELSDLLSQVGRLEDKEIQFFMVLSWIYDLRIIQNRDQFNSEVHQLILDELFLFIKNIDISYTEERIRSLIWFCSGPGYGNHLMSTFEGILIPLLKDQKIEPKKLWDLLFFSYQKNILFQEEDVHFRYQTNVGIFAGLSWLAEYFAELEDDYFILMKAITQSIRQQQRLLNKPFIKNISWDTHYRAIETLSKIVLSLQSMQDNCSKVDIVSLMEEVDDYMKLNNYYEDLINPDLKDIFK